MATLNGNFPDTVYPGIKFRFDSPWHLENTSQNTVGLEMTVKK